MLDLDALSSEVREVHSAEYRCGDASDDNSGLGAPRELRLAKRQVSDIESHCESNACDDANSDEIGGGGSLR